jgi:hypothetical protein
VNRDRLDDVRVIDTDHFIIFRPPEVVSRRVVGPAVARFDEPDRRVKQRRPAVKQQSTETRRSFLPFIGAGWRHVLRWYPRSSFGIGWVRYC